MEESALLHDKNTTLECFGQDLEKVNSADGCELKVSSSKTYDLDEPTSSEGEDDDTPDAPVATLTEEDKMNRLIREYISLTLNSNADPVKLESVNRRCPVLADIKEDEVATHGDYDFGKFDDGYTAIHKRYVHLRSYREILKDPGFEEISPGRVFKRRTITGIGPKIDENSLVIYNYALWNEQCRDPYDSTWLRHNTFITNMSSDPVLPGIRELLLTMRPSEWSEAFIMPEAAFGELGALPRIPPNAIIFCLIEITKVIPLDKITSLCLNAAELQQKGTSFQDFYTASDEARKRGNYYFEVKQYRVALQRYKSGIRILEAITYKNEEEENQAKSLLLKLYNNSARAANASGNPRRALGMCKQALLLNEYEPKAHWNRTMAWKIKGHHDRALATARVAMHIFADDPKTYKTFKRESDELKKQIQNEEIELKELHRIMGRAAAS